MSKLLKISLGLVARISFVKFRLSVFVQDAQDAFLEQERDRVLTVKIVTLQKVIRGWHYRNKFHKMKTCTVVIQAAWRAHHEKRCYLAVRAGNLTP